MKQYLIFIILILTFSACKKDKNDMESPESIPTYHAFTGEIGTNDNSCLMSNDNNLILCGTNGTNITIIKCSKSGSLIYKKDFFTGNYSNASGIVETPNQDLLLCGSTLRNGAVSHMDILLIKTNSNGDTLWTKTYGSVKEDYGYQIIKTNDNNYLICGITYRDTTSGFCDIYLLKIDSNGDTIWTQSYIDQDQEMPFHLMETQNGEILVTGTNEDNSNPRGLYLLKIDALGNKLWDKTIGAGLWKWGYSTIELSTGDLLTCGQGPDIVWGRSQTLILKTDLLGNILWEKNYGELELSETGFALKQNNDSTYTVTGASYNISTTEHDIIVFKIDQSGNQVWYKMFGSPTTDWGMNLLKDVNDVNIISGDCNGNIFMTKIDNNGVFQ